MSGCLGSKDQCKAERKKKELIPCTSASSSCRPRELITTTASIGIDLRSESAGALAANRARQENRISPCHQKSFRPRSREVPFLSDQVHRVFALADKSARGIRLKEEDDFGFMTAQFLYKQDAARNPAAAEQDADAILDWLMSEHAGDTGIR
jgi:hypothetical protein